MMTASNWHDAEQQILARLDIAAEAMALGVRFTASSPSQSGWRECLAIDRDESNASAAINTASSNGQLGKYTDLGGQSQAISFFELAARLQPSRFADFKAARAHYAAQVGVDLPSNGSRQRGRRTVADAASDDPFAGRVRLHGGDHRRRFTELWARAKPPATADGIMRIHGLATGNFLSGARVLVLPKYDPADWCHPVGAVLYRPTGEVFPAYDNSRTGAELPERKCHSVGPDGWILAGTPEQLQAAERVWDCEGSSDLAALASIAPDEVAFTAGASVGNAEIYRGKRVQIIADNDEGGEGKVSKRAAAAFPLATEVKILRLPFGEGEEGNDLRSWLLAGHSFAELQSLADTAEPLQESPEVSTPCDEISNYRVTYNEEGKPKREPLDMPSIIESIRRRTGGWPRKVGPAMFIPNAESIDWLTSPSSLFGWLQSVCPVSWGRGDSFVTKEELTSELSRTSEQYLAVEVLPHEPPLPNVFYSCDMPSPGDGEALRELIGRFRPETEIDADLLLAMAVTPLWGGPPGARPAFALTSDAGRGSGKSKTAELIARIYEGVIDVSANEDIATIKQRLLSPDAMTRRIIMIDNIKSLKFSWAELESLVTNNVISGKRLYCGEATRPNTLTVFLTLNGVSLATDMSQRSVVIKVIKGQNSGTWLEETAAFIDTNRDRLVADAVGFLRSERFPLAEYSRWAAWEDAILCRLPEPGEAQRVILERQAASNAEADETDLIEDFVEDKLLDLRYSPTTEQVRIPVAILADWVRQATGDRQAKTAGISRHLNQLAGEGALAHLRPDPSRHFGRCYLWVGSETNPDEAIKNDLASRVELRRK